MPNRIIREGINDSLRINSLPQLTELFYRRLQLLVDDYGRYEAEPLLLRAKLYGLRPEVTTAEVCAHLRALASGDQPLILIYQVEHKKYLEIQGFGQRTRTEKYPSPANASNCEQPHARASNTNTRSNTNTPPQAHTDTDTDTDETVEAFMLAHPVADPPKKLSKIEQHFQEDWPKFWYRRGGPDKTLRSYEKAYRDVGREKLMAAVVHWGPILMEEALRANNRTPIYPSSWLNAGSYKDEISEIAPTNGHGPPRRFKTRQEEMMEEVMGEMK